MKEKSKSVAVVAPPLEASIVVVLLLVCKGPAVYRRRVSGEKDAFMSSRKYFSRKRSL